MGKSAEELKYEIEGTRADLGNTLDAIGDRVSPGRIVERRRARISYGMRRFSDRVMGTAHQITEPVHNLAQGGADRVSSVGDGVSGAPDALRQRTEGNPLLVGLLALGGGALVASLLPVSEREKDAGSQIAQDVQPIKDELVGAAHEVVEHLKEPAQQAVGSVQDAAKDSAQVVVGEAKQAAADTKDAAQHAGRS
jgi:uncharacterized protein YjbJ (UPF0337 family)